MILRTFGWSFGVTVLGLIIAFIYGGPAALLTVSILAILEISLSFDNAVVNAKVLERMSVFWQKIFLTIGIAIAVFGMRLVFPLVIVGITAQLGPLEAVDLALNDEKAYSAQLEEAYPLIASFGGMFLMLLFLSFIFENRAITWLGWLERPLAKIGELDQLPVVVASLALTVVAGVWAEDPGGVMIAGVLGMVTYIGVKGLGELFASQGIGEDAEDADGSETGATGGEKAAERQSGQNGLVVATGKAAFFLFLYLEVLDASFSFDGVIGAFAISTQLVIIALGLGIGAMYIRSLTVFLVRKGTLNDYVYLEHGAHWAIGALAVAMIVSIAHHVPEAITGTLGAGLIIASFISSIIRNRRFAAAEEKTEEPDLHPTGV